MNKYKELAKFYKAMYELVWNHFIDANELVLEHCNDDILEAYNAEDAVMCNKIKEIERRIKELEEAIAMDEDHEIYKESKQAANKDM